MCTWTYLHAYIFCTLAWKDALALCLFTNPFFTLGAYAMAMIEWRVLNGVNVWVFHTFILFFRSNFFYIKHIFYFAIFYLLYYNISCPIFIPHGQHNQFEIWDVLSVHNNNTLISIDVVEKEKCFKLLNGLLDKY